MRYESLRTVAMHFKAFNAPIFSVSRNSLFSIAWRETVKSTRTDLYKFVNAHRKIGVYGFLNIIENFFVYDLIYSGFTKLSLRFLLFRSSGRNPQSDVSVIWSFDSDKPHTTHIPLIRSDEGLPSRNLKRNFQDGKLSINNLC